MTAQTTPLSYGQSNYRRGFDPSSTNILTNQDVIEILAVYDARNEERHRKILESLESNKKVSETTTTTTVAVPETSVQPRVIRLSGPIQFFLKLIELWRLEEEEACKLLGYELTEIQYVEDVLSGVSSLFGRDPKDRIANLFVIRKRLDGLFKDIDVENEWLREKHTDLNNNSPLELLLSGSMENILLIKEFVEHVSGL